jgi:predicted TIM-barrel fold metal-dependent hydrolase
VSLPLSSPPDRNPRRPAFALPAGSVDCHTHIFAPQYHLSPARGYDPQPASLDEMLHMHSQLGVDRVVFVQPSVYGTDNSAILDAVAQIPEMARAVVALPSAVADDELARLGDSGARGVRLNLADPGGMPVGLDEVPNLAYRLAEHGWHLEFLFNPAELDDLTDLMLALPVPVSIGHFGYVEAGVGTDSPAFQTLLRLIATGRVWIKLSAPYRLGDGDVGPWNAVVPLAQALIAANPERCLWATDWPHPNKFGEIPNDADLADQLPRWIPDEPTQQQILVENPRVLYGFPPLA